MQKILVSSVESKPTKTGGTYTKITDDKGAAFSGFDETLAGLKQGDLIEAEVKIEGKYLNITTWKLLESGKALPIATKQSNGDMSKDDWAEKDRRERDARRGNTLLSGIATLWAAGVIKGDDPLVDSYRRIAQETLNPTAVAEPPTAKQTTPPGKPLEGVTGLPDTVENNGIMLGYCLEHGRNPGQVFAHLSVELQRKITKPTEFTVEEAWPIVKPWIEGK